MIITNRDIEIVRDHVFRVRAAWEQQLLDALWPATKSGRRNGQRRLRALCQSEFLARHVVHAKPVRGVRLLFEGGPDDPQPDCAELSRLSKRCWELPNVPLAIYTATPRARRVFGGLSRHGVHALPALSHDIGVAAIYYAQLLRHQRELAAQWRSEDEMLLPADWGDAQPDAVMVDDSGRPATAVEFAANYESQRFVRLWQTLVQQQKLRLLIYGATP